MRFWGDGRSRWSGVLYSSTSVLTLGAPGIKAASCEGVFAEEGPGWVFWVGRSSAGRAAGAGKGLFGCFGWGGAVQC